MTESMKEKMEEAARRPVPYEGLIVSHIEGNIFSAEIAINFSELASALRERAESSHIVLGGRSET